MPATVNQIIADSTVRHGIHLERFKNQQIRAMVGFLNGQVEPDLIGQLQRYAGRTLTRSRIAEMRKAVHEITRAGYQAMHGRIRGDLYELGKIENRWQANMLQQSLPAEMAITVPMASAVREMVTNRPICGKFVREWFEEMPGATARRVNQQIMIGYTEGEGIDAMVRRIRGTRKLKYRDGILNRSRREIESIVRTSVSGVSNNICEGVYQANANIIGKVMISATLDTRTCEICMFEDGRTYPVDQGPRPPFHFSCRCSTVPVVKGWKAMGLEDPPATWRSSLDGRVPASVTYPQWLRRQPAALQNEALGRRKAQLFRSGKLKINQFVTSSHHILNLKELESLVN